MLNKLNKLEGKGAWSISEYTNDHKSSVLPETKHFRCTLLVKTKKEAIERLIKAIGDR